MPCSNQEVADVTLVLANATEVIVSVLQDIAGNDISTSLNGNTITGDLARSMVLTELKNNILSRDNIRENV